MPRNDCFDSKIRVRRLAKVAEVLRVAVTTPLVTLRCTCCLTLVGPSPDKLQPNQTALISRRGGLTLRVTGTERNTAVRSAGARPGNNNSVSRLCLRGRQRHDAGRLRPLCRLGWPGPGGLADARGAFAGKQSAHALS